MKGISPGTIIVGIFAVLFGLIGAYALRQHLNPPPAAKEAPAAPSVALVPVASDDLEIGRPLRLGDVAILRLPPDKLKERGVPPEYMLNPQHIIGRTLRTPVKKGEAFLPTLFYPQGMGPSVAERLKPGFRAVTATFADTAAARLLTPGVKVDVIYRSQPVPQSETPETTLTLLQSVEVLAVAENQVPGLRSGEAAAANETPVTLALTPEQANKLKVVEGRGELSLAIRSGEDASISDERARTLDDLLGVSQPDVFTTQVFRGVGKTDVSFQPAGDARRAGAWAPAPTPPMKLKNKVGDPGEQPAGKFTPENHTTRPAPDANQTSRPAKVYAPALGADSANAGENSRRGLSGLPLTSARFDDSRAAADAAMVAGEAVGSR